MRSPASVLVAGLLLTAAAAAARGEEVRLTLAECLEQALGAAPEIREAGYRPPIAETGVREADSEFDHLLSFRTSGGLAESEVGSFFGGADTLREQTFSAEATLEQRVRTGAVYSFGFQTDDLVTNNRFFSFRPQWTNRFVFRVSQPVLRTGGRTYNETATRLAESELRASEEEYRRVTEGTLASVERAYWNLVFLRKDRDVRRQSLVVARELLRVAEKRLELGSGTRIESVQAEAGVAEREKELILAEARVRNAEDVLRSFLYPFGDGAAAEVRIVPTTAVGEPGDEPGAGTDDRIRAAFDERPDVLVAKERLEAAGIRVVRAENELLPRLDVFGRVGLSGLEDTFPDAAEPIFEGEFVAWEIGISLEVPLGNRAARARHLRRRLERARARAGFEALKNRVVLEIRTAHRAVETARKEVAATRKATAAALAQFEAEKDRVEADKSTNYQLLEVEEDLSLARSQEMLALVSWRQAIATLEEVTGTYLEWRGLVPPPAVRSE